MTYLQVLQRLSKIYNTSVYKSGQKWPKVIYKNGRKWPKVRIYNSGQKWPKVSIIVIRDDLTEHE
jgi:hypothetical protein